MHRPDERGACCRSWRHFGAISAVTVVLGIGPVMTNPEPVLAQSPPQDAMTDGGTGAAAAPTEPSVPDIDLEAGETKTRPALDELPQLGSGASTDWTRSFSAPMNRLYDSYLESKKVISDQYNFEYSLDFTQYMQIGTKGNPVWLAVYYPSATWQPFTDTAIGSGRIDVTAGHQAYFSGTNSGMQAERLGLITFPNDWTTDSFSWSTISYTHTMPGSFNWLAITTGQYNLFSFDPSEYAGNAQSPKIGRKK